MKKIVVLGVGHFGSVLVEGFLQRGFCTKEQLVLVQRGDASQQQLRQRFGCTVVGHIEALEESPSLVVVAIRPQDFRQLDKKFHFQNETIVLSVMAGVCIADIEAYFGGTVVRTMPNLAAPLGKGIVVYKEAGGLSGAQKLALEQLMRHWGEGLIVHEERLIDSATAISGSGPGVLYWFLEAMKKAAIELHFTPQDSEKLVVQMAQGALAYAMQSGASLPELVKKVASPGGTTEAALQSLEQAQVAQAVEQALQGAYMRCQKL